MKMNISIIGLILLLSMFVVFISCSKEKESDDKSTDIKKKTTIHKEIVKKVNSYKQGIDKVKQSMAKVNKNTHKTEDIISNLRNSNSVKRENVKTERKAVTKKIKSTRSMPETQSILYKKSNNLKKCIKRVRAKSKDKYLAGSIKYQFEILKSGRVVNAKIINRKWSNNKSGKAVEKCILKTVNSWKFSEVSKSEKRFIMKSSMVF